jgi:hypothetical protein
VEPAAGAVRKGAGLNTAGGFQELSLTAPSAHHLRRSTTRRRPRRRAC